uniref:Transposase n=1 Tax=Edwardsiella tarda TaxID=636 RepID=A0A2S1PMM7_EDWTA|nr:hypothetical protein [Edwardsiella tarda]
MARCTIARLMKNMGLAGVLRGKNYELQSAGERLPQVIG